MNEKFAVYGTGRIGAQEATLISGNGFEVTVIGHSQKGIERCRNMMAEFWDDLIREGFATEKNKVAAMNLVTITDDPKILDGSTFVFEAVSEDIDIKRTVFEKITSNIAENAIIASCSSAYNADYMAESVSNPERFIIAHPFQPAHIQPLVEVVCGSATTEEVRNKTVEILERLSRQVVVLNKCLPGFLVNRFAQLISREALYLMSEGVVSAKDVDKAIKYAMGMRYANIGFLEYFDDPGFEIQKTVANYVYPTLCDRKTAHEFVLEGIAKGETGLAVGKGVHDWSEIDINDYKYRKQAPFFAEAKKWTMPE